MTLSGMLKDYAQTRDGKLRWLPNIYLFLDNAAKKKRCLIGGKQPFEARPDANGREYSLFRVRGVHCPHPDKWSGQYVQIEINDRKWFSVPLTECKGCEFHEKAAQYGSRRYARCRWFRENSGMASPLALYLGAVKEAKEMLG